MDAFGASAQRYSARAAETDESMIVVAALDSPTRDVEYAPDPGQTVDYLSRPAHVWVSLLDDPSAEAGPPVEHPVDVLTSESETEDRVVSLHAFNPSHREAKVRVQFLLREGVVAREYDLYLQPLNEISLVFGEEVESWLRNARNVTLVLSTDTPLVINGVRWTTHYQSAEYLRITNVNTAERVATGYGFGVQSSANIDFHEVDCDQAGTDGVCTLAMRKVPWDQNLNEY